MQGNLNSILVSLLNTVPHSSVSVASRVSCGGQIECEEMADTPLMGPLIRFGGRARTSSGGARRRAEPVRAISGAILSTIQ